MLMSEPKDYLLATAVFGQLKIIIGSVTPSEATMSSMTFQAKYK